MKLKDHSQVQKKLGNLSSWSEYAYQTWMEHYLVRMTKQREKTGYVTFYNWKQGTGLSRLSLDYDDTTNQIPTAFKY